jgi:PKHD-type hydroxylase
MPSYLKYQRPLPQFKVVEKFFSEEEVDKIIDLEELQTFTKGKVGSQFDNKNSDGSGSLDKKTRDSDISWIHPSAQSQWLFEKFGYIIAQVNHDVFMYDIDGFDAFQYTIYKKNHHYDWHWDSQMDYLTWERKISASIILSDPKEYGAGEIEVMNVGHPEKTYCQRPNKGDVVFFASWMPHRVRPVTKGTRKSLVAWIMGKRIC